MAILEFQGTYRWLSNFAPSAVIYDGLVFTSVEHAYQAAKAESITDRYKIHECKTPGQAKRLGYKVKLREDWLDIKDSVMRSLLWQKFSDEPYRALLLATGDQEIVEGNGWGDTYWGVCNGVGQNHLGKMIMDIRNELRSLSRGS